MNYWLIYVIIVSVVVNALPKCPEHCTCIKRTANCNSLTKFDIDLHITTLEVYDPAPIKLTAGFFKNLNLNKLEKLRINNATILEVHEDAFSGMNLRHLMIHSSKIPNLPLGLFSKLQYLQKIDFTNSTLGRFDIHSNSVEEIILKKCSIKELPESIFAQCNRLSNLDLSQNLLEKIAGNFSFKVDYLVLGNNNITHFDMNESLESIVLLDLRNNPLSTITGNVHSVETLNLHGCGLQNIDFIDNFTGLCSLDLSGNKIERLDSKIFQNLTELENINLGDNKITALPDNIFSNNVRLIKIVLDGNALKTLPVFNVKKSNIRHFTCVKCNLEILNENTFQYMPSLVTMNLSQNQLRFIPENLLRPVADLTKIDLSINMLTSIPDKLFSKNTNLVNVNLSKNAITVLKSNVFEHNKVIRAIDISYCLIKNLWGPKDKTTAIPSLQRLNAESNQMEVVTIDELNVTPKLTALLLVGNPLGCDSMFEDMREWIKSHNVSTMQVLEETTSNPSVPSVVKTESFLSDCPDETSDDEYDYAYEYPETKTKEEQNLPTLENDDSDMSIIDKDESDYPEQIVVSNVFNKYPDEDDDAEDEEEAKTEEKVAFLEDAKMVDAIEKIGIRNKSPREFIVYLLPTLVFVLTALIVLILSVSAILCVLQKRNSRRNIPQINILPWNSQKMKINSGIVYKPLSEEKIPV